MDPEKSSFRFTSSSVPHDATIVPQPPIVNVHLAETRKRKDTDIWSPLYTLGVFGCMCLLFFLYLSTTFRYATLDNELHRLEEEVHTVMERHHTSENTTIYDAAFRAPPIHHGRNHKAISDHAFPRERKHHLSVKRAKSRMVETQHVKRGGGSTLTWFHPGAGACGGYNDDNDFIIAISHLIWNDGAHCGDTVTISYRGETVQATVVDECMGCDSSHIDLSPGLLRSLVGSGADMVTGASWTFGTLELPKPKPATTHHSTTQAKPTTTSALSTLSSSSVSSVLSSSIAYATPLAYGYDDGETHNLEAFEELLVNFGGLVLTGATAGI